MNTQHARWTNPVLTQETNKLYTDLYGNEGDTYISVLKTSPYEIAIISRFLAYLEKEHGGEQ